MTEASSAPTLPFLRLNDRPNKPRGCGITEVRGPYYSVVGTRYLEDLLEIAGEYVDWLKIPGPGIALTPAEPLASIVSLCHQRNVKVSAGGLIEMVLTRGSQAVSDYFDAIRDLGFDVVEVSAGMLAISTPDYLKLVERAKRTGLTVKAEVGVQFGAGGSSTSEALEAEGMNATSSAVRRGREALVAGADMIVLESEGVTESVQYWRTDVPHAFVAELGLEKMMFEAADPAVFTWYIKNFGPDVNLFVDHGQTLHLESLRSGVWGPTSLFGRIVTYRG